MLIYQTMVPMWERARRFSNIYAFATLDVLFTAGGPEPIDPAMLTSLQVFWFAAFVAMAVWNAAGISAGAAAAKVSSGNCSTFAFGPEEKCELAKATASMGAVILWVLLLGARPDQRSR